MQSSNNIHTIDDNIAHTLSIDPWFGVIAYDDNNGQSELNQQKLKRQKFNITNTISSDPWFGALSYDDIGESKLHYQNVHNALIFYSLPQICVIFTTTIDLYFFLFSRIHWLILMNSI